MNQDNLVRDLESKLDKVHTQSLDISFNELLDMYLDGELDIKPEYQRLFRWTEGARSRFIESLLLEMPVPPIYVVEDENGSYELIDGLQRFSSYLHLRGQLEAPHLPCPINKGDFLKLEECDIVKELDGHTYDDLPLALKIRLKRAFVRVEVVRKGSDKKFRYHMFKRLNTGGTELTQQQIRNCVIRMLDSKFIDFLIRLSKNESYAKTIIKISDDQRLGIYDQELVLRFFALKNNKLAFVHDISEFLTEFMEIVTDSENNDYNFDYGKEEILFKKTFNILKKALGEKAFGRWGKNGIQSNFAIYQFESIVIGIQSILDKLDESDDNHIEKIKNAIIALKSDKDFITQTTGGGKNSKGALAKRLEISESHFMAINL